MSRNSERDEGVPGRDRPYTLREKAAEIRAAGGEPKPPITPREQIAEVVKRLRNEKGWSAAHLAEEMTKQGIQWDRYTVSNLERGRRENVTVAELFALSVALDVAPVHLLAPPEDNRYYQVTPAMDTEAVHVRNWIRGWPHSDGLPGGWTNRSRYIQNSPDSEDLIAVLTAAELAEIRTGAVMHALSKIPGGPAACPADVLAAADEAIKSWTQNPERWMVPDLRWLENKEKEQE